jgi:hypothetical protein
MCTKCQLGNVMERTTGCKWYDNIRMDLMGMG